MPEDPTAESFEFPLLRWRKSFGTAGWPLVEQVSWSLFVPLPYSCLDECSPFSTTTPLASFADLQASRPTYCDLTLSSFSLADRASWIRSASWRLRNQP